ncbi:P-loop containing nucleoside triphosphate hydrolase protein [Thelephora ganbajun]|uniref:P-loop containing nucleoside triphosphate hydrolase protein n=1 Tax=Thelephora ganbajun TaxID=370292 RepID=A0ACB6ZUE5_THEGA|nr:P-loop containing nucleoside triphosphate hydrolase protein [Thelephora ganbajun]
MDALKSLVQPLVGGGGGSSMVDGVKLVVLGGTVETARRMASSGWNHFINSFFLTAHFSEEDYPYDWLMLWLSRRPEWQRSREFETTTRTTTSGLSSRVADNSFGDDDDTEDDVPGKVKTRVVFQPTANTTHTIYYRGHWLRVRRGRKTDGSGCEVLSISVVARNNSILKQLVLQAKKEYEAEAVHRIQIYFADSHGCWRWTDSRHKRPISSIVLNPGVKEMLLADTKDFLKSEKWYADRGIPFRRGYLLHGVPGSGKSSLIHAIAGELMLDIYVVSLSSSWINDSTLTTLMGRVPARCIVLLEDLDAAFTRSTSRDDSSTGNPDGSDSSEKESAREHSSSSRHRRSKDHLSDTNTLSLSGLLNALDGVAAAEGRLLFATTNHLERLDPALSRPGRMDVWVEFKNASKWQAEALFRNFFPSTEEDEPTEAELASIELPSPSLVPVTPSDLASNPDSDAMFTVGSPSLPSSMSSTSISSMTTRVSSVRSRTMSEVGTPSTSSTPKYLPPAVEDEIAEFQHSAPPIDAATLSRLARQFADSIPEDEFSVAALQGYLLKNKSRPECAASAAAAWVVSERELRERLKKEKEARELKEKLEKEKRRKELEHEKKEKEAEEAAKAKETSKEETPKPTENATAAPVQTKVIPVPPPTTQESSSDDGNDNDENVPPATGSSGWVNVDESSSPTPSPPSPA